MSNHRSFACRVLLVALAGMAQAHAQSAPAPEPRTLEEANAQRARAEQMRRDADARYAEEQQACYAKFLVNVGGAFLLPQSELTPEAIALIRNYSRSQLLEMAEKARSLAKPDAADAVAQLCTDIAK